MVSISAQTTISVLLPATPNYQRLDPNFEMLKNIIATTPENHAVSFSNAVNAMRKTKT